MREGFNSKYNWLEIQALALGKVQAPWVPTHLQVQAFDQSTLDIEEGWNRCAEFAEALLKALRSKVPLAAVMSANIDYWPDEGLRRACIALDIPFTALYREVWFQEQDGNDYFRTYHFKTDAAGMAVAGQFTKDILARWNVLPKDKLTVTGLPRFDWWFKQPTPDSRATVVLLTFTSNNYLAGEAFCETLREFAAAAMRHRDKDLDFIVKCKHKQDLEAVQQTMQALFPGQQIDGLQYSTETNLAQALRNARAVVGFNSLSLIESLLSRAAIYDIYWGEAKSNDCIFSPNDPQDCRNINFLGSPQELATALDRIAEGKSGPTRNEDERLEIVQRFVDVKPGVSATSRVDLFIEEMGNRGAR